MPLVSSSIPNLINGISQQPPEIRLPSQCERQVNGFSTVARGLEKRPGTEHKKKITSTLVDDTFVHTIRRDRNEEYTMVLTRASGTASGTAKTLKIYDQEGISIPVKTEPVANATLTGPSNHDLETADLLYLDTLATSGGVRDNIVATTVADTTFLINKTKTVTEAGSNGVVSGEGTSNYLSSTGSTQIAGAYTDEGLIFVKAGDYSSKYVIKIVKGGTTYKVGLQTPSSQVGLNQTHIGTPVIAKYLKEGQTNTTTYPNTDTHWDDFDTTGTPAEGFGGWRCIADRNENGETSGGDTGDYVAGLDAIAAADSDFSISMDDASGSVISIKCKATFSIEVQDSKGGAALVGIKDEVTSFSGLPGKNVPVGYIVKVVGNAGGAQDDYYVKYEEDSEGVGVWKETLGRGIKTGFDITTMPHRLIRLYDTQTTPNKYFLFEAVKETAAAHGAPARFGWSSRKAGDDTSNSFPSFTGGKINDITFHQNRFGILSDENIIFSEAGNYYNFFPISVMTALDGNPIDISVSNNQVSILTHAAAFNKSLFLVSDFQQFSLSSEGEGFTPSSVSVDVVTQFESTSQAAPVSSGKFVYFPFERGEYSGVREYFVDMGTADANDATDITAHVPQYIKGNITKLVVSSNDQMVAVLSDDDKKRIYVYKNFWQGQEKLQNSWSHWEFDGDILNCAFLGSTMKLLVKRADGLYLEDINLSLDSAEAVMEDQTAVLLDRRVKLTHNQTVAADMPYYKDATCDTTNNDATVTMDSTTGISAGMRVLGTGIPAEATVASVTNTTTFELSANATASNSNTTLVFLPSNIVFVTDNARKLSTIAEVNEYLANGRTLADGTSLATSKIAVYAGIPYNFEYEFSRFIHKENETAAQTAKLQIRNINLLYSNTGFFNLKINVDPGTILIGDGSNGTTSITPRKNYEKTFSGMITNTSSFGQYKLLSGTFKGGVMSKAANCNIVIENNEYLPCSFQSAEWEGFLHQRSRRV